MKKPVRLLLVAAAALTVALLLALGLALHSGVQTWAARRALAAQPGLKARLGMLNAGFQTVEVTDLRLERDGAVVTLPTFHAELSVIDAGLNEKVNIRRLVAKGWTLDLTHYQFPSAPRKSAALAPRREFSLVASAYAAEPGATAAVAAATQVFQGVFAQAALPFELTLDGVELEGDVLLPPTPGVDTGRAHVVLNGGGLASGREGALTFNLAVALTGKDTPVNALSITGRLAATMDTPRTFSRLGTKADASATGPQFPMGVKLSANVAAARDASGENYTLMLASENRQLVAVQASFPKTTLKLDGTWKLDLRDADLAPFSLGRPLPTFTAAGEGRFTSDPAFGEIHTTGKLDATADKLAVVKPALAGVGAVRLTAEFDLARRGDALRIERLTAALAGAQPVRQAQGLEPVERPVARVQSLQTFEFNFKTRELKVADPSRELFGVVLEGVPLAWAQPVLPGLTVSGGDLRGEFAGTAHDEGLMLRPKAPLAVTGLSVTRGGEALLRAVDLTLFASADYTPQGWQVDVAPFTARHADATLFVIEAKAGQLTGKDQPIKVAGKFSAHLPALLAQPAARGSVQLAAGDVAGTFAAESLNAKHAIQASLAITNLAAHPKLTTEKFPAISADLRADLTPNGTIALNVPLLLERDGRKSDLTVTGTLLPNSGSLTINAQLTSTQLFLEDAKILAAPLASAPEEKSTAPASAAAPRAAAPPWAGLYGQLSLTLKKVIYSNTFQVSDVTGTLRLDAGAVKLDGVRAGFGEGSDAKFSGGVTFDAKAPQPYALAADLAVNEFDPAPLFKALNPSQPATVEGKFTVASKLAGHSVSLGDLATGTHGDFQLTSKGGTLHLPVNVSEKADTTSKIASLIAKGTSAIGAVTGRKDYSDIANKAQAVAEVSKLLKAIQYDQLNLVLSRDAALNTVLKDFTLIAPEMRLTGGGQATHKPGAPLLDEALAAEFKLRARGHTGDLLKYLGALDATADELGYAACTLPLKVGGTIGKPDTSDLNNRLTTLAIEKSGALDLLNKLIPGGGK